MSQAVTPIDAGSRLERRERGVERVVNLVPYVGLVLSAMLSWAMATFWPDAPQAPLPGTFALAALTGAWMLWFVTLHPTWEHRTVLMHVYFLGLIAMIGLLVVRAPIYGFFAFTGYLHAV